VILTKGARKGSKTIAAKDAQAKNGATNPAQVNLIFTSQGITISGGGP
jgi:hypothetical protein